MTENKKKGSCSCGRSPVGRCLGWHDLTESDYQIELGKFKKKSERDQQAIYHPKAIDGLGD